MPEWTCPNCRGGFPTQAPGEGDAEECPWCGQSLDASYEYEPRVSKITKATDGGDDQELTGGPIYRKLFGWLDPNVE